MLNTNNLIFKTIPEWLEILPTLKHISLREKENYSRLLKFSVEIPDVDVSKEVVLVRCPGRYRDFAGHTDMKGCGGVLCGSASAEAIYGLYQLRSDGEVVLHNQDKMFSKKKFPISSTLTGLSLSQNWDAWDQWTTRYYKENGGDQDIYGPLAWDKYIKGLLFLLSELPAKIRGGYLGNLPGFTGIYSSDLSYSGGKSSSSALVVNAALGLDALYGFEKPSTNEWIDLIGMSEWFTMTRGGCADPAQMFYSKENHFTLVGSFPTALIDETPIPSSLTRVIVHSGIDRPQDKNTLMQLRSSSAGYILAILYIKQFFPELKDELESRDGFYHFGNLREFTSIGGLDHNLNDVFDKILRILPVQANRALIFQSLPDYHKDLDALFLNHPEPEEGYYIRDIALFSLSEIERAIHFMIACKEENINEILKLVKLSHDGDRVNTSFWGNGKWLTGKYDFTMSDSLLDVISRSLKTNPDDPKFQLRYFSGRFRRSIPEMDFLADIVNTFFPQDAAIRVMGAGFGGEMHAFVKKEKLEIFLEVIHKEYFEKVMNINHPKITILENSNIGANILST